MKSNEKLAHLYKSIGSLPHPYAKECLLAVSDLLNEHDARITELEKAVMTLKAENELLHRQKSQSAFPRRSLADLEQSNLVTPPPRPQAYQPLHSMAPVHPKSPGENHHLQAVPPAPATNNSQEPQRRRLLPQKWKNIQSLINAGYEEKAFYAYPPEKLSVPAGNQQARRNQQEAVVDLHPHDRGGEPHYFAFQLDGVFALIPSLKHTYNKRFIQIVGLDYFFEFNASTETHFSEIREPALLTRNGESWALLQKGILVF